MLGSARTRHATCPRMRLSSQSCLRSAAGCKRSRVPKALGVDMPSFVADNMSTEQLLIYSALAAPLLSFVAIFGVVPRFKQHFREAESWKDIYTDLMALGGVQPVTPQAAVNRAKAGCVLALSMHALLEVAHVAGLHCKQWVSDTKVHSRMHLVCTQAA